jgi:hypothetical protein
MTTSTAPIRIGHSPDPDDAFMYYAIAKGLVDTGPRPVEQVLEDIESLNRRALAGELEITAVSIHAYAHLADRYALMPCGASMGDGYGPIVVARTSFPCEQLRSRTIAIPGTLTSAYLALRLFLGTEVDFKVVPFDRILDEVASGGVDAGLVIHEGQLTYPSLGLELVLDLGKWFDEEHRKSFGHTAPSEPVEIVSWRLRGIGRVPPVTLPKYQAAGLRLIQGRAMITRGLLERMLGQDAAATEPPLVRVVREIRPLISNREVDSLPPDELRARMRRVLQALDRELKAMLSPPDEPSIP